MTFLKYLFCRYLSLKMVSFEKTVKRTKYHRSLWTKKRHGLFFFYNPGISRPWDESTVCLSLILKINCDYNCSSTLIWSSSILICVKVQIILFLYFMGFIVILIVNFKFIDFNRFKMHLIGVCSFSFKLGGRSL